MKPNFSKEDRGAGVGGYGEGFDLCGWRGNEEEEEEEEGGDGGGGGGYAHFGAVNCWELEWMKKGKEKIAGLRVQAFK